MACSSSFEALLDEYVDGTLGPRERARTEAHLRACDSCPALLEEVRVIDALLLGPRQLEPAPNFSFKVMAEARSMHPPHRAHVPHLLVLGSYLAFAWIAIGLFFWLGDGPAWASLGVFRTMSVHFREAFGALATATERLLGPHTFGVTAAMSALLLLDFGLALAVFALFYLTRRRAEARIDLEA